MSVLLAIVIVAIVYCVVIVSIAVIASIREDRAREAWLDGFERSEEIHRAAGKRWAPRRTRS